jgi:hypothetical protein
MAERARQDAGYFPGATASADADLQKPNTAPRPVPGAGLLRQLTPSFSPKRESTAEATADTEEKPTGPFWSLSS